MSFQIHALPASRFEPLFGLADNELARQNIVRMIADNKPGFPCRISLADAEPGETVLLMNFEHLSADSPFRASHAIFVRETAGQAFPAIDEIPEVLSTRLLSVRAFDARHFLTGAEVVEGPELAALITAMFEDPAVSYLHLHSARPGCYLANVSRA